MSLLAMLILMSIGMILLVGVAAQNNIRGTKDTYDPTDHDDV